MKAVSIVGYKKSGKTTLTRKLADALEARGKTVTIAKFTHTGLAKPDTDTGLFMKEGRTVIGLGGNECTVHWGEKKMLPDVLPLAQADYLLVEGGKTMSWLPRVILLRSPDEQKVMDRGLAIASFGEIKAEELPNYSDATLEELVDCIEEKAFMLPALDCGACGEESCEIISQKIVAGKATMKACKSINNSAMTITVNGSPVGLNPFVENIIRGAIEGMLGSLKGYAPGSDVEIKISK
ncbi:molybdopterin-guanine dinucleotide biosynthesis protein MobB [Halodesulfovibrio marinisediminis]|uniref:Molybdopterin-guanine dinucleotide biosynthesis protein B n=1 Tax=Halodesulfovibrio marinisediminis DSM 17456 TaxID=1121457 RepID=A0A1N6HAJ7_9BACT|nr:molybdopterin-guanine dinucleotide biosynthesis protein MobB [Halodesulfovibrio marinisediminis]SIO16790.1 molybdopterin-guanine dinucleotide biosynthesis protein B [Halodesulfovibrio marinisediminis DSM 17456]